MRLNISLLLLLSLSCVFVFCGCEDQGENINVPGDGDTDSPVDGDSGNQTDGDIDQGGEIVWPEEPDGWIEDELREPRNIHLTWQNSPADSITVQWTTNNKSAEGYEALVWFVPADEAREQDGKIQMPFGDAYFAAGEGTNYEPAITFKDGSNKAGEASEVEFTVEIKGLSPDTEYYYRAGSWDDFDMESGIFSSPNLSEPYKFRTGPAKGSDEGFTIVMAGDSRSEEALVKIAENAERLAGLGADFWLFNGDFTSMGTQSDFNKWFPAMAPILHETVLMPVHGNHEMYANVYFEQFALPRMAALPENRKEYGWSFDYGNTHFVGLGTNTEELVLDQVDWLREDLEAASKDEQITWIIAMTHHSTYSACTKHGSTVYVQKHFVPLFEQYGVDLVYSGHDHTYERTVPIKNNAEAAPGEGILYVVAGGFYNDGYSNGFDWWTAESAHGEDSNYVVVEISGDKIEGTAYYGDGSLLDEWSIIK